MLPPLPACALILSTDACSVASVRPQMVTAAPSAAATRAHAAPMPVPPPVTSTPVPSRPPFGLSVAGMRLRHVSRLAPIPRAQQSSGLGTARVASRSPTDRGVTVAESSGRLLPELTGNNEFFWKSGEDGKLRFQRCAECGELRHPPVSMCPYCHSNE